MKPSKFVINYIKNQPKFRERRNKNRGIANLILKNHPSVQKVPPIVLTEIITEILTMDRTWRLFMSNNPEYRGEDYKDAKRLSQTAQMDLGYRPGVKEDLKKLSTI